LLTPSHHLTQAGVNAYINALPNVAYAAGYEYFVESTEETRLAQSV
jgi:hypothetical protein